MKILWLTWKDLRHPQAGGAEVVNEELAIRLAADGHTVRLIVAGSKGLDRYETINGYSVTRLGNRYSVYWHAYRYYKKFIKGWPDVVIDEMNTVPFFASRYAAEPVVLFVHQLCRIIWFFQMKFPLSLVGYLLEPVYLRLLKKHTVITVSESSKDDLVRYGFDPNAVHIISEGIRIAPIDTIRSARKSEPPVLLSLGSVRPMKRTMDQVKAFEVAKQSVPELQLIVAGDTDSAYGRRVCRRIAKSPFADDISILGRISETDKIKLMRSSRLLMVTSVKEGWGLVVTEAASQGTPSVVYDVDGLRDSVFHGKAGVVAARNNPIALAEEIVGVLGDRKRYDTLQRAAYDRSKSIHFSRSYDDFMKVIGAIRG